MFEFIYFPLRALGEPVRILFYATETPFVDTRVPREEWAALKPTAIFGQMPLLKDTEDPTFVLAQSRTIQRFLAKRLGLMPEDELQAALADSYREALIDMWAQFTINPPYNKEPEERKALVEKYIQEKLPGLIAPFERQLQANGNKGILVGDKLSYVDYTFFVILEHFVDSDPNVLQSTPGVAKLFETVKAVPGVAAYIARADRPKAYFK